MFGNLSRMGRLLSQNRVGTQYPEMDWREHKSTTPLNEKSVEWAICSEAHLFTSATINRPTEQYI